MKDPEVAFRRRWLTLTVLCISLMVIGLDNTILNTYPEKWPPWPDLPPTVIYLTYPNYYIEPFHYPNPVTGKAMPPPSPRAGGEAFGRQKNQ